MKDTRIKSLIESMFNIMIGLTISFISNLIIFPLFNLKAGFRTLAWIGIIYTGISLVRSYLIRRLFVNGFYEAIKNVRTK